MTWDEFLSTRLNAQETGQIETDILCPHCNKRFIYYDSKSVLPSYPGKHRYWCACGWFDYAPAGWDAEDENPAEMRWIPVEERLPEERKWVLTTVHWRDEEIVGEPYIEFYTGVMMLRDGEWYEEDASPADCFDILAWMPVPEPYKGGE